SRVVFSQQFAARRAEADTIARSSIQQDAHRPSRRRSAPQRDRGPSRHRDTHSSRLCGRRDSPTSSNELARCRRQTRVRATLVPAKEVLPPAITRTPLIDTSRGG
ncbi:unnamed protein product, partial [Sphacelaria rigidula]